MFVWDIPTFSKVERNFRLLGAMVTVDKVALIASAPIAVGLHDTEFVIYDWIHHYIEKELEYRIGFENLGGGNVFCHHLHKCIRKYPYTAFAERSLVIEFLKEYEQMLREIDDKARIVTGENLVVSRYRKGYGRTGHSQGSSH